MSLMEIFGSFNAKKYSMWMNIQRTYENKKIIRVLLTWKNYGGSLPLMKTIDRIYEKTNLFYIEKETFMVHMHR